MPTDLGGGLAEPSGNDLRRALLDWTIIYSSILNLYHTGNKRLLPGKPRKWGTKAAARCTVAKDFRHRGMEVLSTYCG